MNRQAVAISAVLVLILVVGTVVMFAMSEVLDRDSPVEYTVEGMIGDLDVTGKVVCEDTHESGVEKVLRFTYALEYGGESHVSESYLITGLDGHPNEELNSVVGQRVVDGIEMDVWQADKHPGYGFCLSDDNRIVEIVISIDGSELTAR